MSINNCIFTLDDTLIIDSIGSKNDFVTVPYSFGVNSILAHLNTAYYHIHGESFVYPDLAQGIRLTSGSSSWADPGSFTTIIPEDTLTTSQFDLHWVDIYELSDNAEYEIKFYSGASGIESFIGSAITQRNSNFNREGQQPLQIPQQVSGSRISAKLFSDNGSPVTCRIKLVGHYYA